MTGSPGLLHLDQNRIRIAVNGDIVHHLHVSARFPFHPEFLSRPAPEPRPPGFNCLVERCPVHPGHHENPATSDVLDDRRDQAVACPFQLIKDANIHRSEG